MEIYDHPTFRMACQQFDSVADHLEIPAAERDRLKFPKRSMTVALPIKLDNGETNVCGAWQPGQNFAKGKYTVEIYNKGYLVGTGAFNLK